MSLENYLFHNNESPKKGCLLIAEPFLDDLFFGRSVILLCENNKEGSFGFVLNNYREIDFNSIDKNFPKIKIRISLGGPLSKNNLFFIHSLGPGIDGSTLIAPNLYYGGDFQQLCAIINSESKAKDLVRFFLGYSGWESGQLANEMMEKSWIAVNNISSSTIFNTENMDLWSECLAKQGERFRIISKFPQNPQDN